MKFLEACKELDDGKSIRLAQWPKGVRIYSDDGQMMYENASGYTVSKGYKLSIEEANSDNWEAYTPPMTIGEAIDGLLRGEGKRVTCDTWPDVYVHCVVSAKDGKSLFIHRGFVEEDECPDIEIIRVDGRNFHLE